MAVVLLFGSLDLTGAVVGIFLLSCSTHRNKGKHNISQNKADTYQSAFTADIQHTCKQGHQYARYKESVGQDLDIHCQTLCEKAL